MTSYWTKRRRQHADVQSDLSQISQDADHSNDQPHVSNQVQDGTCTGNVGSQSPFNIVLVEYAGAEDSDTPSDRHLFDLDSDSKSDFSGSEPDLDISGSVVNSVNSVNSDAILAIGLAEWSTKKSVPHNTVSELLDLLRPFHTHLPKDPRTLMGTLSATDTRKDIKQMSGGAYYHFGIAAGVKRCLSQILDAGSFDALSMQVNVDGVPVFKSTNSQFWPIQGLLDQVDGHNFSEPFLIGLFYGNSKPKNLDFLGDFLVEFEQLKQSGLDYNGSNTKFDISVIVCDAPKMSNNMEDIPAVNGALREVYGMER